MRRQRGRRRWALGVVLVAAAGLAYAGRRPLLTEAGRYLVRTDPLRHADAIAVLAGSLPDRILEAVALYQDGYAPRIILSRAPENAGFARLRALGVKVPMRHELNRLVAERLGVPPTAIVEIGDVTRSTFDEARLLLDYARAQGYRTLLVVTSKLHTRRAGMIYDRLAGDTVHIIVRPSRYDGFRPDRWWTDRASLRRVVFEYEKLLVFLAIDRWRLRAPVASLDAGR